jgi:hypothetical protein
MQLDIFEHSRDVMLRNDAILALERRDAVAARSAIQVLGAEYSNDKLIPDLNVLIAVIEGVGQGEIASHMALRDARLRMLDVVQPSAMRVFGNMAGMDWLRPMWKDLAQRATRLPFKSDGEHEHCAPLWLNAGDWAAAVLAIKTIPSWRRIPAPLAWMARANLEALGLQATWAMLAELAWLSPHRLIELKQYARDPLLKQLMNKFETDFEGSGDPAAVAWFPAWALIERPSLADPLAMAQRSNNSEPEQAMRLMVELLGLERQGGRHQDIVVNRKALRDCREGLFMQYMKARS